MHVDEDFTRLCMEMIVLPWSTNYSLLGRKQREFLRMLK